MGQAFSILDKEITLSKSRKEYINLRYYFAQLANDSAIKFRETYNEYDGISQLVSDGFQDGWNLISEAITIASDKLIDLGDFSSTPQSFYDEYFQPYSDYERQYSIFHDQYMQINLDAEQLKNYKAARKENRGRLIGGGFGVEGAAKGIAMASAANLATGAVHGAFNTIGNMVSDSKKRKKLSALFNNNNTPEHLQTAIYQDILNIHIALFKAIADKGLIPIDGMITIEAIEKSKAIFENVQNGKISDKEMQIGAVTQSLQLNPIYEEAYHFLMINYPSNQKEIDTLASFCKVDLTLYKLYILDSYYNETDMDSEESIKSTLDCIQERAGELMLVEYDKILERGNTRLEELDIDIRTYEGELYETRSLTKKAKEEHVFINELFRDIGIESLIDSGAKPKDGAVDEDGCKNALALLKESDFVYHNSGGYIAKLEDILQYIDKRARTFEEHTYETREITEQAKKDRAYLSESFSNLGIEFNGQNEIDCSDGAIEPGLKALLEEMNNNKFVYNLVGDAIDEIEQLLVDVRTFEAETYESNELAQKAAEEQGSIETFFETLDFQVEEDVKEAVNFLRKTSFGYKQSAILLKGFLADLEEMDLAERTVSGVLYDSREEAKVATEKLNILLGKADNAISSYQSDKSTSFYIKGSIPDRKIIAFVAKANQLFGKNIQVEDMYAYVDDTLWGGGDDGIGLSHSYIVITKGDNKGVYPLVSVSEIDGPNFLSESISFCDKRNNEEVKYKGNQGKKGLENLTAILKRFTTFQLEKPIDITTQEAEKSNSDENSSNLEAKININNEQKSKGSTGDTFSSLILENFKTNEQQSIFVKPNLNSKKITTFSKKCKKKYGVDIDEGDIYAYFDETLLGTGDNGVAITSDCIIVLVDNVGVLPLSTISKVKESGMINKKITILLKSGESTSFILTQGNKGAIAIKDIIQLMINKINS